MPTHLRRSRSRPATSAITSRVSGFHGSASSPSPARPRSPPRPDADIGPAELGASKAAAGAQHGMRTRQLMGHGWLRTSFSASRGPQDARRRLRPAPRGMAGAKARYRIPRSHKTLHARYRPRSVASRRPRSATRFCAARGVTPSSLAIMPAEISGRQSTNSISSGNREVERRPSSFRRSSVRARSQRSCCFMPSSAATAIASSSAMRRVAASRLRRRSRGTALTPSARQGRCALVHRFRNSNHVRRLGRACRTMCGDGCRLNSSMAAMMRSLSSCLDATRIWRKTERASLEKKPSTS